MKQLKPFKITIEGKFCEAPHKDRLFMLYDDSDKNLSDELKLDSIDVMVICHEISCFIKRKLQKVMTNEEIKNEAKKFNRYHFGKSTGNEKLVDFKISISGFYCEDFREGRKLEYKLESLTEGRANLMLYEIVCVFRNELSKTMSRQELTNIAIKHKIENFGMLEGEVPFDIRDDGKKVE